MEKTFSESLDTGIKASVIYIFAVSLMILVDMVSSNGPYGISQILELFRGENFLPHSIAYAIGIAFVLSNAIIVIFALVWFPVEFISEFYFRAKIEKFLEKFEDNQEDSGLENPKIVCHCNNKCNKCGASQSFLENIE